jgi:hypothetical protein
MQLIYFYTKNLEEFDQCVLNNKFSNKQLSGVENWIKRTYFQLYKISNKPFKIVITDKIPDEGIIFFHKGYFEKNLKPNRNQYFVCAQADHGRNKYAQMHITQNPCQILNFKTNRKTFIDNLFSFTSNIYIPNWKQHNIIPRSIDRGCMIENVYFFGRKINFIDGDFEKLKLDINKLGLNLVLDYNASNWSDYSKADIVLAIRDFNNNAYYHKPFAKLVNALSAKTLIIAAPESSSLYFKKHYFPNLPIASNYDEFLLIIKSIINDPAKYFKAVDDLQSRLSEFEDNNMALRWVKIFEESIKKYNNWKSASLVSKKLFFLLR